MAAFSAILKIYFCSSSPEPKVKLTRNMWGSIGATCRSKIANILRSEILDCRNSGHLKNLFCASSHEQKGQLTWNLGRKYRRDRKSKMAAKAAILKIYFALLLLNRKSLVGSIGATCRWKNKIIPIGNPRLPQGRPSWKFILLFFSWTERPIDLKLR